jgi:hypothetical protein
MRLRQLLTLALVSGACGSFFICGAPLLAEDAGVAVANHARPTDDAAQFDSNHPLAPALKIAYESYDFLTSEVQDYSCRVVKREQVDGRLRPYEYFDAKVRQEWREGGRLVHRRGVYLKYAAPTSIAGRQVLWVDGQNDNKLIVRRGGKRFNYITVELSPDSDTILRESNYSPADMGMLTIVRNLIEVGQQDMRHDECEVKFFRDVKIDKRPCTCIQVSHPERREHFKYHIARIYVDDEYPIPLRYEAYDWPEEEGGKAVLLEEFTFQNIQLNVGFADAEFRRDYPAYGFRD